MGFPAAGGRFVDLSPAAGRWWSHSRESRRCLTIGWSPNPEKAGGVWGPTVRGKGLVVLGKLAPAAKSGCRLSKVGRNHGSADRAVLAVSPHVALTLGTLSTVACGLKIISM